MEKKELKKVQTIAKSYYLRKDIQQAIFEFCKNRETVANFNNEYFAKRPDFLDYPNDVGNLAKSGATSFHCSEELWSNPLDINTNMTPKEYNEIKIGWDFLIDIDSKYFDYSKLAAQLLIKALEHHGVKNIGIKYSGSKGFHILIPFKAFPSKIGEHNTKDMFPEWPRLVASYLFNLIKEPMYNEILKMTSQIDLEEKGELTMENICPKCGNKTDKKVIGKYKCQDLKCRTEVESMKSNRKQMICPSCNGKMIRISKREISFCETCKINTSNLESSDSVDGKKVYREKKKLEFDLGKNKTQDIKLNSLELQYSNFEIKKQIDDIEKSIDIILVASRHLFRAPYSLHEKTAYASIVIDKKDLPNFKPSDADPLKIKSPRSFMPDCEDGEAKDLLAQALDKVEKRTENTESKRYDKTNSIDIKGLEITEEMFPPVIKKILKGIKQDGRKRALYLLLSFYNSLEFPQEYIKEKLAEWNDKNYAPLKEGYLQSQITWFEKRRPLPPNYDKPIYKEFGITSPPEPGMKNPINYTIKKALQNKNKKSRKSKK